jgi:hypothetical protein
MIHYAMKGKTAKQNPLQIKKIRYEIRVNESERD